MLRYNFAIPAAALAAAIGFCAVIGRPARAQTIATVTVAAGAPLSNIPPMAFGLNTAVWDGHLLDVAVPSLITGAGVTALRYPGGLTSDRYNWKTNSIVPGQPDYAFPQDSFDLFMRLAREVGAAPIITVNYGSNSSGTGGGSPGLAAEWVQYANLLHHYDVKYWEIGNEIYGNGEYGVASVTDMHRSKDPWTYGSNVVDFIHLMKAADKTIKVGAVLVAPGNAPDAIFPDWNSNVLTQCGKMIDFVIVHWYPQQPGYESDAALLASPQNGTAFSPGIAAMMARLRSLIRQYAGASAANVQILVTETNSVAYNPGKQTVSQVNALFIADSMLTWLENGATSIDVWDLHDGSAVNNNAPNIYGTATYGDYGILSIGGSVEPAANTPQPTYYGLKMLSKVGRPGDTLVTAGSDNSLLAAHAVLQASGKLALLLINKDPANATIVNIMLSGLKPVTVGELLSYGAASTAITSTQVTGLNSNFSVTVAPYSLTVVLLSP
jgi:hypothetical protein